MYKIKQVVVLFISLIMVFSSQIIAKTLRLSHHHAVGGQIDQSSHIFADIVNATEPKKIIKIDFNIFEF